ncbi:MAG: long-chain-fatty-acid--CoA ligase [Candidatus Rokubacteria bacterium]|nr:long-chain-fatty-acid--CoA ligase [Candidatus Rokubacteria bacterium]
MRLHDFLDYRARERPASEFAVQGARRVTYGEALAEANRLARAFAGAGLGIGDRVAVLSKNSVEYAVLYYAASKAGVIPVPLNYRLAPPEWAYIVNDAWARMLIASAEYLRPVDAIRGQLASVERYVAIDPAPGDSGWEAYRPWVGDHPATPPDRSPGEDAVLYQMYTSGTTGRPKGALLTHRAVTANLAQFAAAVEPLFHERWLIVVPMYHASGAVTSFACVYGGGCLVIQQDFNPAEVVRALSEEGIARTSLVPAMIQACLVQVADVAERSYERLRLIAYGASPIAEHTLRRAIEVFACDFLQAYGMTETSAVLTYLLPADHHRALREKPGLLLSAGRALVGTEVRVVDETDRPVPDGVIGEIVARGPQLMQGYWNRPEESAEALRGGWMHTGDAGTMDDEGFIYIQDRVKDMIVSGGENIYPRAVEDVLFQHPAVADVAVIGVPDERWGEAVKAVAVLRAGATATAAELIDFCRGKLGGFERPRSVDFVEALPRNPSGKALKRVLREPYWAGRGRRVAGS